MKIRTFQKEVIVGNYQATPDGLGGFILTPIPGGLGIGGLIALWFLFWPALVVGAIFGLLAYGVSRITGKYGKGYAIAWSVFSCFLLMGILYFLATSNIIIINDLNIIFGCFVPSLCPFAFLSSYMNWPH